MEGSAPTISAQEGQTVMLKAFDETLGSSDWGSKSGLSLLPGGRDVKDDKVWTLEELATFESSHLPCYVLRNIAEAGGPRVVLWSNTAAVNLFGEPRTTAEVLKWWQTVPEDIRIFMAEILKTLHNSLMVKRQKLRMSLNARQAFTENWKGLGDKSELSVILREEAVHVNVDGKVEACSLNVIEAELTPEQLRNMAMVTYSPIHSYLFSSSGQLLYANHNACLSLREDGHINVTDMTLASLLVRNGKPQETMAREAIEKICSGKVEHLCITLTNMHKGKPRYNLYELWPARDPANNWQSAVLVSSFDVTRLKGTERELKSLKNEKDAWERHNSDMQAAMHEVTSKQAQLEAERQRLQARLKDALQLHMAPAMRLDTSSPIDRTVALLDGLLEGQLPDTQDILAVRNTLLQGTDLRRMQNLETQLKGQMNLSEAASESLVSMLQDNGRASRRLEEQLASASPVPSGTRRFSKGLSLSLSSPRISRDDLSTPRPHAGLTSEVDRLLQEAASNWDFDMMLLDKATEGHSLSCFGFYLLQQSGLLHRFSIPEERTAHCLRSLEEGYQDQNVVPYHNRVHAASVLHMSQMLVHCPEGLADCGIIEPVTELSLYYSAIAHDFQHPGLTNDFLCRSHHMLAMRYNCKSPLENHHASAAFLVMWEEWRDELKDHPVLQDINLHETIRATMTELILATDMRQHFSLVSRLQGVNQADGYAAGQASLEGSLAERTLSADQRLLIIQMTLKCADLGHLALPASLHRMWVERLQAEFYAQGDQERKLNIPVSALMDRTKANTLCSSQVGFFEVVALPMMKVFAACVPGAQVMLEAMTNNYRMWRTEYENHAATSSAG